MRGSGLRIAASVQLGQARRCALSCCLPLLGRVNDS